MVDLLHCQLLGSEGVGYPTEGEEEGEEGRISREQQTEREREREKNKHESGEEWRMHESTALKRACLFSMHRWSLQCDTIWYKPDAHLCQKYSLHLS